MTPAADDARGPFVRHRHPFLRRPGWHPLVAGGCFGLMLYRAYLGRSGPAFYAGLAFIGLWFGLSIFDAVTGHRLLNWLYNDERPGRDGG